ncbi:MAG: SH3 domain-containing protein [Bryobacteraceae bacterium]
MLLGRSIFLPILIATLFTAGCGAGSAGSPAMGEAYAGPATLNLRKELAPQSATTATVKHGEKLEILGTRRRFVKVRTAQGAEGWTDGRLLLTPEQMEELRRLASGAAKLESQGMATIYEPLNMHSEPNRLASSFYQIPQSAKLDVLAHCVEPRVQPLTKMPFAAANLRPAAPPRKPKAREAARAELLPPAVPAPPANWLALSRTVSKPAETVAPPQPKPEPRPERPVRLDDWSLVRTRDGKAGWVLSRLLNMAIPDEVAQYAEGHRITSYFSLGEVHDGTQIKHNWLWTTMSRNGQPYEFDRMRVFTWSARHHRYETAYMEKELQGYYPVTVSVDAAQGGKASANLPEFSLITEGDDGKLGRTTYVFNGYRVQVVNRTPYTRPEQMADPQRSSGGPATGAVAPPHRSWLRREWQNLGEWRHRWFK